MPRINYDPNSKEYQAAFGVGRNEIETETITAGTASMYAGERFMIVGLGGQGVRTVAQIKKLAQKRFANIAPNNCNVVFAALDTDTTVFPKSGLDQQEFFTIPIDQKVLCEEYNYSHTIQQGNQRRPFPASWVNYRFESRFDPNGAGQNRQQSKAIFHHNNSRTGRYTANDIKTFFANRLGALRQTNQDVRIYFITGIGGGTGSGSFIETAQMIRRAFAGAVQANMKLEGVFYLPDILEEFPAFQNPADRQNMYANAYAALKELDYYFAAKQRTYGVEYLTVEQQFGEPWEVSSRRPLFDTVRLVSGSNGVIIPASKNLQAIQTVSEAIINLIADSNLAANVDNNQDYRQTEVNQAAHRRNVLNGCYIGNGQEANQEAKDVCADDMFEYLSVGTASLSILQNPIKMNMIARTMRTLSNSPKGFTAQQGFVGFQNAPVDLTEAEVNIAKLNLLSPETVFEKLRSFCRLTWKADVDLNALCNVQTNHADNLASEVEVIKANNPNGRGRVAYNDIYNILVPVLNDFFDKELENTKKTLDTFMKQYGPKALHLLYEGISKDGRFPVGKSIHDILQNYSVTSFTKKDYKRRYNEALDEGRKASRVPINIFSVRSNACSRLSEVICNMKQEELAERASAHTISAYNSRYSEKLDEFFNQIGLFEKSLDALYDVYDNLGKAYENGVENGNTTQNPNSTRLNALTDKDDFTWADEIVKTQASQIDFNAVKEAIIESFEKNPEKWTEFDPQHSETSPRNEMDRIMVEKNVANLDGRLTLTRLFANRITNDPNWVNWLNTMLVNALIPKAEPLYRSTGGGIARPATKYLLVPNALSNLGQNGPEITAALESICNAQHIALSYTTLEDSITCYSSQFALPLYSLQELSTWEKAYESMPHFMQHSNESGKGDYDPMDTGLDWVSYPALCLNQNPRIPDRATGRISKEGNFFLETIDPMFKTMKEMGLIEEYRNDDGAGNIYYSYRCYLMTKRGWDWGDPETFNYVQYAANTNDKPGEYLKGGKTLVQYLAQQNRGTLDDPEVTVDIRFGDSQDQFTQNCTDPVIAEDRAKRVLRRNAALIRDLKETKKLYEKYAAKIDQTNDKLRYDTIGRDMLWLVAYGAIEKIDNAWYLKDHAYNGEYVELLNTDPIAVKDDWRFQGEYRFEYLALRDAFVKLYGRDAKIVARIQAAQDYAQGKDVMDLRAKSAESTKRKKAFLETLNNVFVSEAEAAEALKKPENFSTRQELSEKVNGDIVPLLNAFETGVTQIYQLLK